MADEIEVHIDPDRGVLSLDCGEDAFVRLRDLLISEANLDETVHGLVDRIHLVEIQSAPRTKPSRRWGDRFAVLTCGLVAFVFCFVFAAGVFAIIGWFHNFLTVSSRR